jgi:hypothetical protein
VTVRGVARIVFGVVCDWARGVAICTVGAVDQARKDVHTFTHLAENIRDGCTPPDDLLAVYEAHQTPYEDTTRRDGVAWR